MNNKTTPFIVVCYYDTKVGSWKKPRQTASRCTGEMVGLCEQLRLIAKQMPATLRHKDVRDLTRMCLFHYENFLFRVYALRDRVWDVLAALADKKMCKNKDKKFRNAVLSVVKNNYPDLNKSFSSLHALIEVDVKNRNVATHQTFILFGLTYKKDLSSFQAVDSILEMFDPESEAGVKVEKTIWLAMQNFILEQTKRIRDISNSGFDFVSHRNHAIKSKSW